MKHRITTFTVLGIMCVLYLLGLGVRQAVRDAQYRIVGDDMSFTLESALHFRRIRQIMEGEGVTKRDTAIEIPGGIDTKATYSFGAETVYARLARLFPSSVPLAHRLRWIESGWFCLGIPLIFLWIYLQSGSLLAGLTSGGFYAVTLSSVIRSTGQELSRENFAIPFLLAHLACDALSRSSNRKDVQFAGMLASAAFLACALASWDLLQFYLFLWIVIRVFQLFSGTLRSDELERRSVCVHVAALVLLGLLNPYHRAHGLVYSPLMWVLYAILLSLFYQSLRAGVVRQVTQRKPLVAVFGLLLVLVACFGLATYFSSYGHFLDLFMAKIRFLNQKPADPSLLSFEQRIMWAPALHSATSKLTFILFPYVLLLTLAAVPVLCMQSFRRSNPKVFHHLFFFAASLLAFVFFVRFHVFLAMFSAGLLGLWASWAQERKTLARWTVLVLLALGWTAEAGHVLRNPEAWGRTNIYYTELDELVDWLRSNVAPEPVLADFRTSASALTYAGCPIVLHPKFESKEIRNRVERFGELQFKGTEKEFRDWADAYGVRYYVYALGQFASQSPELQMRYMVDALEPPEHAPALKFERAPHELTYFSFLWGNKKYRVFKMITREDEAKSEEHAQNGLEAFQSGQLDRAEEEAATALALFPGNTAALDVMRHVSSLRDRGFAYQPDE